MIQLSSHILSGLNLSAVIGWSLITLWALPNYARAVAGRASREDWIMTAIGTVGIATVIYQARVLLKVVTMRTDYCAQTGLILMNCAALIVFLTVHLAKTPEGHKRALVISHLVIFVLCMAGGFIE